MVDWLTDHAYTRRIVIYILERPPMFRGNIVIPHSLDFFLSL